MIILDGKAVAGQITDSLKADISRLGLKPNLDIVLVGSDPASLKYVELKQKQAALIGIGGQIHHLNQNSSTSAVIDLINNLNHDPNIIGLMVQLPLPSQIDTNQVLLSLDPAKDADGLNPLNLALLFQNHPHAIPSATSLGIIKLMEAYHINFDGKNAVIINRSPEVGLPLFAQLTAKNATVTLCHSHTQNLDQIASQADILISAIGKPKFFDRKFIKTNAVVIDVGYAVDPNSGKVTGDFNFDDIKDIAGFITPVPGGIGPMTVASLLFNTVQIAKNQ